jgi:hypothetical protein
LSSSHGRKNKLDYQPGLLAACKFAIFLECRITP